MSAAISYYTPIPHRHGYADAIFNTLLHLIQHTPAEHKNRIVILKSKLPNFALSPEKKKILIQWREGKFEPLKDHPMTIEQEWKAVCKAFTLEDLSIE